MPRSSTAMPEQQVARIASDNIADAFRRLPYDNQNPDDTLLGEHFLLSDFNSQISSRLRRIEDKLKKEIKAGTATGELISRNYKRTIEYGTPRSMFDKDAFINLLAEECGIAKHKLVEIAQREACFKHSATPMSFEVDYIGDINRSVK